MGKVHQKRGQFNIFNSLDMDSKVQFEKGAFYTTFDIHPTTELPELLYGEFPELPAPLLSAITAHREYVFFEKPVFLTYPMVQLINLILDLLIQPMQNTFLLDMCVITLFGFAVSCKLEMATKRFRYDRKPEIEQRLTGLMHFRSTAYYAKSIGMSATSLKQNFHICMASA